MIDLESINSWLKPKIWPIISVHWHWHSVSTLTVLTQYGYGPYSNIIFHGHYHSKRHSLKLERVHPNSNILERVHPYSNMTFKKGLFWNSNGLTPIHFAAIHGFLYILALKIDFCWHYFLQISADVYGYNFITWDKVNFST